MIRLTLLWIYVFGLAIYAWKDWYRALCGLILLMAVIEHPDMPKNMFGVQGLNPWNGLLLVVVLSWFVQKGNEGHRWDFPKGIGWFLTAYLSILLVSTIRLFGDPSGLEERSLAPMVGEYLINTFKWVLPGLLLFFGCRSKERLMWGIATLLLVYFLLAIQVVKWMPLSSVTTGNELAGRSLKILAKEIGYHRVNLSMMLGGASWAILATRPWFKSAFWPIVGFLFVLFAQALTGGRAGYLTWTIVGLVLCLAKWRHYLLLTPIAALVIALAIPGAVERMTQGFGAESRDSNPLVDGYRGAKYGAFGGPDDYTITAGRSFAWPFVIDKINDAPLLGHGRQAMIRTGLYSQLLQQYGESFPHPHNAYLEILLDAGILGALLVLPFYAAVLLRALRAFRSQEPDVSVAGGVAAALILALLAASIGSQTFYPREGAVGMWCAIGLLLRVSHVARSAERPFGAVALE